MIETIALIRHGEYHQQSGAPSAHQPHPLNTAGEGHARTSAEKVARFLQVHGLQLHPQICCSRMLRGWQTAEMIRQSLQAQIQQPLTLQESESLAERSVGSVANLTADEIGDIVGRDPRYPNLPEGWKSDSQFCLPFQGAESLLDAGQRVARYIEESLPTDDGNKSAQLKLFVGHGAAFRHAAFHMGAMAYDDISKLSMFHDEPIFLQFESSDRKWNHLAGEWKVRGTLQQQGYTD